MARWSDRRGNGPQAAVVVVRCGSSPTLFGIRMAHDGAKTWWATWAFEIDAARAAREGYSTTMLSGNFQLAAEYPGCPGCGNRGFVYCEECQTVGCWSGSGAWTCGSCGVSGVLSALTDMTAKND